MGRPTIGEYAIEAHVGSGRTGDVYVAIESRSGRTVALRVLRDDLAADERYRERVRRETALLATLDERHILPIYAVGADAGIVYIATRLVGGTLAAPARTGRLAVERVADVLGAVAAALDAAHAAAVVHGDVSPSNVRIEPGHVYLADFGLAPLGAVDYRAPEQRAGPAADVYALACLAVEALTGAPPFVRGSDAAVAHAHAADAPPNVSRRRPELPAAVDGAIAAGMAKDPGDRPATAGALVAGICEALVTRDR